MVIVYFSEDVKGKGFFGIFKKLNVCFDLVRKSLYWFVSDSSDSAKLYFAELRSADSNVPEGKLNFFLNIISLVLNFAFLSLVDRLGSFSFLYDKKNLRFFCNDFSAQRVIVYFYDSSKTVGIFLNVG